MGMGLILVYLGAVLLALLPAGWLLRLRRRHGDPFLEPFQAYTLAVALTGLAILVVRHLAPALDVVSRGQGLRLGMAFGLVLVPALIAMAFLFMRAACALLQRPAPKSVQLVAGLFWGLFFIGFMAALVLYFRTGSMTLVRILDPTLNLGLVVHFGTALALLVANRKQLQGWRRPLLPLLATATVLGGASMLAVQRLGPGQTSPWLLLAYLFPTACCLGITAWLDRRLGQAEPPPAGQAGGPAELFARHRISPREQEVVQAVLEGRSNAEIAARLFIAEKTVETHLYRVYQKLGVKNRIQLLNRFRG